MADGYATNARPDYDESRAVTYEVTFRNWLGIKVLRLLTVSYQKLQLIISDIDNGKAIVTLPASQIKMAIQSEHVETQVTILTQNTSREAYKVWFPDPTKSRVRQLIRDINKLVELQRDVIAEGGA